MRTELQQQTADDRDLLLRKARRYGESSKWNPDEYEHRHALEYASKIERWVEDDLDAEEARNANRVADDQISDAECVYWTVKMDVRDEMIESFVQDIGQGMILKEAVRILDGELIEYFQGLDDEIFNEPEYESDVEAEWAGIETGREKNE